jgi:transposase
MLTWEDDVEVHALRKRGWSISAIARHTGHDRKTIRYAEFRHNGPYAVPIVMPHRCFGSPSEPVIDPDRSA